MVCGILLVVGPIGIVTVVVTIVVVVATVVVLLIIAVILIRHSGKRALVHLDLRLSVCSVGLERRCVCCGLSDGRGST